MSLPRVEIKTLQAFYSPFSGLLLEGEDVDVSDDSTVLFIYYGALGEFAHLSDRVVQTVGEDAEDVDIEELIERLDYPGGFVIQVDTDWNGINYYGFAPAED